jgi:hypothetical protein
VGCDGVVLVAGGDGDSEFGACICVTRPQWSQDDCNDLTRWAAKMKEVECGT